MNICRIKRFLKDRWLLLIFVFFYFIFSFLSYKDFGITWDEYDVYVRGNAILDFYNGKVIELGSGHNNWYPALILYITSLFTGIDGYNFEYLHLFSLLFSVLIFIFTFEILFKSYKNKWYAILGPVFLFLMPRFLGHIPANPKDVPFAILYFISISSIWFLKDSKRIILKSFILGTLFGLSYTLRFLGIGLFVVYFIWEIIYLFYQKGLSLKKFLYTGLNLFLVGVVSVFSYIFSYPYLWKDTGLRILRLGDIAKNFPWKSEVLFNGAFIKAMELPWNYLFTWFSITTPVFILLLLIISVFLIKKLKSNELYLIFSIALILNGLLFLILRPVIYDGLRHFLFLLPIISLISCITFIQLFRIFKYKFLKIGLIGIFLIYAFSIINTYKNLHPYQYVYFNTFAGGLSGAYEKYETDYWGASLKEAVEWLGDNEIVGDEIKYINTSTGFSTQITYFFKDNMRWCDFGEQMDYFIATTRGNIYLKLDQSKLIHKIERDGVPLALIYKL